MTEKEVEEFFLMRMLMMVTGLGEPVNLLLFNVL